jgi:catecholate siderophore receptor
MEKTNAKTTDLTGATVLAGDQDVKGVEFGLSGNITPRWGAYGGASFMNGEVKGSGVVSEIGAQLPYVPKATLNLWSSYRLPMGLTLGGGANYNSGNYFNQTGTFNFVAGGTTPQPKYVPNAAAVQALTKYWIFNAVAMYQLNKHVLLQVNGTNLGNERYADRAYDRHFLPGPTRQVVFSPVITF